MHREDWVVLLGSAGSGVRLVKSSGLGKPRTNSGTSGVPHFRHAMNVFRDFWEKCTAVGSGYGTSRYKWVKFTTTGRMWIRFRHISDQVNRV